MNNVGELIELYGVVLAVLGDNALLRESEFETWIAKRAAAVKFF